MVFKQTLNEISRNTDPLTQCKSIVATESATEMELKEAATGGVLQKKVCKFYRKIPVLESLFNKVTGP